MEIKGKLKPMPLFADIKIEYDEDIAPGPKQYSSELCPTSQK